MNPKVLVPDDLGFVPRSPGWEVVTYDPAAALPSHATDAAAIVVFGTPAPLLRSYAAALTNLRWVQSLAAGVDPILAAGFAPDVIITSGRGLHDLPVSEHVLALLLAAARSLPTAVRAQVEHRWAAELGGRRPFPEPDRFASLVGAHIGVWGYGSIGRRLATILRGLGSRVTGIVRIDGGEAETTDDIAAVLPTLDALVVLLPGDERNRHIVNSAVLALLPRHAWLVSAGRGMAVDESALVDAVERGALAGAALDVFEHEPLPAESPLWDLPNVLITPHMAGGRLVGAQALIEQNLAAFLAGEELTNVF